MYISTKDWLNYIKRLSAIDNQAAERMQDWIRKNGFTDRKALIDYAYGIATTYGEASGALSAAMYDAIAEMKGKWYPPAVPAPTPEYGEVAKTVNGILKHSEKAETVAGGVSRLVKRTGADTTLLNAERDGAQFAWVPNGDTCAFCLTLASRGWQYMSKKALKNGHAEHIHANCDCTYAIRFGNDDGVAGYDPDKYKRMYYGAEGSTPQEKINSLRRMHYEQNKDLINAQKRAAYSMRDGDEAESDLETRKNDRDQLLKMDLQFFAKKTIHAEERAKERKIKDEDINDALLNPLNGEGGELVIDEYGQESIKYIGRKATVCVSTDETEDISYTVWKTSKATRKRYEK